MRRWSRATQPSADLALHQDIHVLHNIPCPLERRSWKVWIIRRIFHRGYKGSTDVSSSNKHKRIIIIYSLYHDLTLSTVASMCGQGRNEKMDAVISATSGRQKVCGRVMFWSIWSMLLVFPANWGLMEMQDMSHNLYQSRNPDIVRSINDLGGSLVTYRSSETDERYELTDKNTEYIMSAYI